MFGQFLRDHHPTWGGFDDFGNRVTFIIKTVNPCFNLSVNGHNTVIKCMLDFRHCGKNHTFTWGALTHQSDIIKAKDNILRRNNNRGSVSRMENIIRGHHQNTRFKLCLKRKRHMNSHLVSVKVCIKSSTNKRV